MADDARVIHFPQLSLKSIDLRVLFACRGSTVNEIAFKPLMFILYSAHVQVCHITGWVNTIDCLFTVCKARFGRIHLITNPSLGLEVYLVGETSKSPVTMHTPHPHDFIRT